MGYASGSHSKIAKRLRRHPSTIAHEVKENRTFIKGNYPNGKDCRICHSELDAKQKYS
ncbi:helix-turn-helix domain-containing protein [Roseburia lenta]|uniref:helix-turn-helix domain-containing protein n=1 Tax=Roseburia lenta TaxID=2763061 RepID=UPI001A9AC141